MLIFSYSSGLHLHLVNVNVGGISNLLVSSKQISLKLEHFGCLSD